MPLSRRGCHCFRQGRNSASGNTARARSSLAAIGARPRRWLGSAQVLPGGLLHHSQPWGVGVVQPTGPTGSAALRGQPWVPLLPAEPRQCSREHRTGVTEVIALRLIAGLNALRPSMPASCSAAREAGGTRLATGGVERSGTEPVDSGPNLLLSPRRGRHYHAASVAPCRALVELFVACFQGLHPASRAPRRRHRPDALRRLIDGGIVPE